MVFCWSISPTFSGVQKIMVTGTSVRTSKEALRLTRIYPGTLYSTAGKPFKFPTTTLSSFAKCMYQYCRNATFRYPSSWCKIVYRRVLGRTEVFGPKSRMCGDRRVRLGLQSEFLRARWAKGCLQETGTCQILLSAYWVMLFIYDAFVTGLDCLGLRAPKTALRTRKGRLWRSVEHLGTIQTQFTPGCYTLFHRDYRTCTWLSRTRILHRINRYKIVK